MKETLIPMSINITLMIISMIWVNWDFLRNHKEFWEAIKGKDKVLQTTEICIYIWVRILPLVVLSDLFLDYKISKEAWYSLDFILFSLIAGNVGHKFLDNKNPPTEK